MTDPRSLLAPMEQAEILLQQLRDAGFTVTVAAGTGHWVMSARRDGQEASVRGDDYLRVVRALAVSVGFACRDIDPTSSGDTKGTADAGPAGTPVP